MHTILLSVAVHIARDQSNYLLFAAAISPLFYHLSKKRKIGWFKQLLLKRTLKKHRYLNEGSWKTFFIKLLVCLGIFGILLLFLDFGIAAALMLVIGTIVFIV